MNDELSTLWIVTGNDLPGTVSTVASDAEITPPLYFILAWLTTKLGSAPELVRLPSLIAGTISIPLVFWVGRRAVGPLAGLIAATVMTLSPYMIFFSTDGRAYALMIALLLGSTLAMLAAAEGGRTRWWFVYGLLSCLAVYSHYTSVFVLAAQFLWLLWAHPAVRRPALLTNVAAGVAFLPWLPSALADTTSPTIDVLAFLQGSGFTAKRIAVEVWAFGYPNVTLAEVPGHLALLLAVGGLAAAVTAAVVARFRARHERGDEAPWISKGLVLVLALALATPVAEGLIALLGGTDLFGARNLNASSGGLALAIGAVLAAAGPLWCLVCTTAVLGGYTIGAARTLDDENATVDLKASAAFIEAEARPGDVVIDGSLGVSVTPVPLTALDAHLSQDLSEYRLELPSGEPPFLPFRSPVPSSSGLILEALEEAGDNRIIYVAEDDTIVRSGAGATAIEVSDTSYEKGGELQLPDGSRIVAERRFVGVNPINVVVIEPGPGPATAP